jgi:hypothetical protein
LQDGAADPSTIRNASTLLSESGTAALGIVINKAAQPRAYAPAQGKISGLAS